MALVFGIKGFYSATDIRARTPDRLCHGATHGHDTGRNKTHMRSNSAARLRDPCLLIGRKWPAWALWPAEAAAEAAGTAADAAAGIAVAATAVVDGAAPGALLL